MTDAYYENEDGQRTSFLNPYLGLIAEHFRKKQNRAHKAILELERKLDRVQAEILEVGVWMKENANSSNMPEAQTYLDDLWIRHGDYQTQYKNIMADYQEAIEVRDLVRLAREHFLDQLETAQLEGYVLEMQRLDVDAFGEDAG